MSLPFNIQQAKEKMHSFLEDLHQLRSVLDTANNDGFKAAWIQCRAHAEAAAQEYADLLSKED